jgi:hypothetical protein
MKLVKSLCRLNQRVLQQKIGLMEVLTSRHGIDQALCLFRTTCPIIKATIGQHVRHSVDHIARAAAAALAADVTATKTTRGPQMIHYDTRERNTPDEHDWTAARVRIERVAKMLEDVAMLSATTATATDNMDAVSNRIEVQACFMLSGDENGTEYALPSSIVRELGFAAHHAIHHMAMIKIAATCSHVGQLNDADLPVDIGRAPSTAHFDNTALVDPTQ